MFPVVMTRLPLAPEVTRPSSSSRRTCRRTSHPSPWSPSTPSGAVWVNGLGVMVDVPQVNSVLLYAGTVGVSGLAVLLLPFGR